MKKISKYHFSKETMLKEKKQTNHKRIQDIQGRLSYKQERNTNLRNEQHNQEITILKAYVEPNEVENLTII